VRVAVVAFVLFGVLSGVAGWVYFRGVPPPPLPLVEGTGWHDKFLEATSEEEKTRWCRVGAEAGDPAAMNMLGFRLVSGLGCTRDDEEAVRWGRKGAELGHSNAMFGYARMLEHGSGTEKDLEAAAHWYRRSVAAGDPQAPHHLERLLEKHPELRTAPGR
jgi:TPR repeat protein